VRAKYNSIFRCKGKFMKASLGKMHFAQEKKGKENPRKGGGKPSTPERRRRTFLNRSPGL